MENQTTAAQRIFFSYSRQDGQEHALKLASDLRAAGANVWIDQLDIELGKLWDLEVEKALNTADCVLFIATEKSTASNNVLNEVYYALDENKKVIPVVFHDCRIPFQLRRLQRIDFTTGYEAAFQRLLKALGLKAEAVNMPATESGKASDEATMPPEAKEESINQIIADHSQEVPVVAPEPVVSNDDKVVNPVATSPAKKFVSRQETFSVVERKDKTRKGLFIGLGVLALAVVVFLFVKNFSGSSQADKSSATVLNQQYPDSTKKDSALLTGSVASMKPDTGTGTQASNNTTDKNSPDARTSTVKKPTSANEAFNLNFEAGKKYYAADAYDQAIGAFNRASVAKNDAENFYYRGLCSGALKNFPAAIEDYSKAIGLNSNTQKYYFSRAAAYHNNKDFKASVSDWNKVIELSPNNGDAYFRRGINKRALNDASACDDFATAAKLKNEEGQKAYDQFCGNTIQPKKKKADY